MRIYIFGFFAVSEIAECTEAWARVAELTPPLLEVDDSELERILDGGAEVIGFIGGVFRL